MKKLLKIGLIIIILLVLLIVLLLVFLEDIYYYFVGYHYLKQKYKISEWPDYYQELAKKCRDLDHSLQQCCIESIMVKNNWELEPETGCPEGFQLNMLRCMGSYRWCEPME